ncbi:MAG: general stress protein [Gemmataceae bacterium]
MNTPERITAVEVFADRTHAEYAVAELRRHGFAAEQIGILTSDAASEVEPPPHAGTKAEEGAAAGAAAGATLGGLVGAALATAVIPGVGVAIAGGLLAGAIGGAVTGLATGGIVGALVGLNIPEDDARHYERAFHSGRTLVTVRADARYDEAVAILRDAAEKSLATGHHHGHGALARLAETEGDSAPGAGTVF